MEKVESQCRSQCHSYMPFFHCMRLQQPTEGSTIRVAITCGLPDASSCSFTYADQFATICGGGPMTIIGDGATFVPDVLSFPDAKIACVDNPDVADTDTVDFSVDMINNALVSTVAGRYTETFFKVSNDYLQHIDY